MALLPLVLALLSRTNGQHRIVVKASSACNVLALEMLTHGSSGGIFLYSSMRRFILAMMRDSRRAKRIRAGLGQEALGATSAARLGLWWPETGTGLGPAIDDDAKLAAWVWLGRLRAFARMRAESSGCEIAAIAGDEVPSRPLSTLRRVVNALDLPDDEADIEQVAKAEFWQRDAKMPSVPFDQGEYASQLDAVARTHGDAIDRALDWAGDLIVTIDDATMDMPRKYCGMAV